MQVFVCGTAECRVVCRGCIRGVLLHISQCLFSAEEVFTDDVAVNLQAVSKQPASAVSTFKISAFRSRQHLPAPVEILKVFLPPLCRCAVYILADFRLQARKKPRLIGDNDAVPNLQKFVGIVRYFDFGSRIYPNIKFNAGYRRTVVQLRTAVGQKQRVEIAIKVVWTIRVLPVYYYAQRMIFRFERLYYLVHQ